MTLRAGLSPLALSVFCLAVVTPHAALAANPFPDWVVQAAASKLPSYPANTGAVVLLDDRLVTVAQDGRATERERRVLKILRPRGREDAQIVASYSRTKSLITSMPGASVPMATNTRSRIRRYTTRRWGSGESSMTISALKRLHRQEPIRGESSLMRSSVT